MYGKGGALGGLGARIGEHALAVAGTDVQHGNQLALHHQAQPEIFDAKPQAVTEHANAAIGMRRGAEAQRFFGKHTQLEVGVLCEPRQLLLCERAPAISVIASRTPSAPLMHALDTLMHTDPTIMVRRSAVVAGAGLTGVVPEMRETLAWVASNDPEPKMRELAGGYL
jgi:hypothetical protein